jgi:hypothetical protein
MGRLCLSSCLIFTLFDGFKLHFVLDSMLLKLSGERNFGTYTSTHPYVFIVFYFFFILLFLNKLRETLPYQSNINLTYMKLSFNLYIF